MPPYHHARRRRFGGNPRFRKPAVSVIPKVRRGKRGKCDACNTHIEVGDPYTVLRLSKRYAPPCATCGMVPKTSKRFHNQCVPPDTDKAMGYDPNKVNPNVYASPASHHHSAAPPPRPQSAADLQMAALVAVEAALKRRLAENPALANNPELEAVLKKYQGCKAHVLRPANDHEGAVALKMALKRALDLVF